MTFFHFLNCVMLTFGPHVIYYKATPLCDYDTFQASFRAVLVHVATSLLKLISLATFLQDSDSDEFDANQEILKGLIGFLDVAGIYFALTRLSYRNISQAHKFQAVGLGWAFADALLHRLIPLWVNARGLEFSWDYLAQSLESNANLVLTLSMASLTYLIWLRKNKPAGLAPILYLFLGLHAAMPVVSSFLRKGRGVDMQSVVGFEIMASAFLAFVSWRLYSACSTRP